MRLLGHRDSGREGLGARSNEGLGARSNKRTFTPQTKGCSLLFSRR
jgi:hypothetical protein